MKDKPLSEKKCRLQGYEKDILYHKEDVKEAVDKLKEGVEDSQYDYANLQHVMKDKVIELIDTIFGNFNQSVEDLKLKSNIISNGNKGVSK